MRKVRIVNGIFTVDVALPPRLFRAREAPMADADDAPAPPAYVDFAVEVDCGKGRRYPVRGQSPEGGATEFEMKFPFTSRAPQTHLLVLENALLRARGTDRLALPADQAAAEACGQALFEALLPDGARSLL